MRLHIHPPPAKPYALGLQSQTLFDRRVSRQLNLAARAQHPLPRQSKSAPQSRCHLARRSRNSRRTRHSAVGRHFAARDRANRLLDPHAHFASFIRALSLSARTAPSRRQVYSLRDEPGAPSLPRFCGKGGVLSHVETETESGKAVTPLCGKTPALRIRNCARQTRSTAWSPAASRQRAWSDSPV